MEHLEKYAPYATMLILIFEFLIGHTKLVKANSTLALVMNSIMGLLELVFPNKNELPKPPKHD